jgi:hypothetical protein
VQALGRKLGTAAKECEDLSMAGVELKGKGSIL